MYIRCAFFEGNVKPGQEKAFHDFVTRNLLPLWTKFPGATDVHVLSQKQADTEVPTIPWCWPSSILIWWPSSGPCNQLNGPKAAN